MVIAKLSETEAAIVGSIDLQWKSDELSFSVFRTFTAPTTGNAEFIILMGLPTDESGFEVSQKLPAQFGQELSTTTIPEPAAYSVILSVFSVILTLLRVRTKRQNVQ